MLVTELGIVMDNEVQLKNILSPIRLLDKIVDVKLVQFSNIDPPRYVTLFGIETAVKFVQFMNDLL